MAGGIQPGTVATDELARTLDKNCKQQAEIVFKVLASRPRYKGRLTVQRKLSATQIPNGRGACQPDGYLWFWDGKLICTFEAKKQQDRGNAIERWHKNHTICRLINPEVSYVTYAVGEGAYTDGTIGRALSPVHAGGFNVYVPGGNSTFFSKKGFTPSEIGESMIRIIEERISHEPVFKQMELFS